MAWMSVRFPSLIFCPSPPLSKVVLFLLDKKVTLILLSFKQLIHADFCLNMLLCHLRFVAMVVYVCGSFFFVSLPLSNKPPQNINLMSSCWFGSLW